MAKVVTCPICGRQFETSKPNKKYCSYTCKEASAKGRRMNWQEQNPGYYKAYMQQYRKKERQG